MSRAWAGSKGALAIGNECAVHPGNILSEFLFPGLKGLYLIQQPLNGFEQVSNMNVSFSG